MTDEEFEKEVQVGIDDKRIVRDKEAKKRMKKVRESTKIHEVKIDGCVVSKLDSEKWLDDFIEWLESRGEYFGGGINTCPEDEELHSKEFKEELENKLD